MIIEIHIFQFNNDIREKAYKTSFVTGLHSQALLCGKLLNFYESLLMLDALTVINITFFTVLILGTLLVKKELHKCQLLFVH